MKTSALKSRLLLLFVASLLGVALLAESVPQDPAYHSFADARSLLGVSNAWNVLSNLPFVVFGAAGLWALDVTRRAELIPSLLPAYRLFFLGIFATGFGSAYYHYAPTNETLVWDRLPMTVAFMALFCIILGEYISERGARRLLVPLLALGVSSVFYWRYTESIGAGDLRPYALVQFVPIAVIPVVLLSFRPRFTGARIYWGMLSLYALAKLFEHFDHELYSRLQVVSGHSIKHLFASAVAPLFMYGVTSRSPLEEATALRIR